MTNKNDYIQRIKEKVYCRILKVALWKRSFYLRKKRRKLNNKDFTIISNNCIAGYLYHDLGLRFLSPTINLLFKTDEDYIEFLSHFEYYTTNEPFEISDEEVAWPVGQIARGNKRITIHFMHYKSFDEAKTKWKERRKRIDNQRMVVLWFVNKFSGPSEELFFRFKQLNYTNKLLITGKAFRFDDSIVKKVNFIKEGSTDGKFAKYKWILANKRFIDEIDFVKYFNEITFEPI